jgi:hypothetical protein
MCVELPDIVTNEALLQTQITIEKLNKLRGL